MQHTCSRVACSPSSSPCLVVLASAVVFLVPGAACSVHESRFAGDEFCLCRSDNLLILLLFFKGFLLSIEFRLVRLSPLCISELPLGLSQWICGVRTSVFFRQHLSLPCSSQPLTFCSSLSPALGRHSRVSCLWLIVGLLGSGLTVSKFDF